MNKIYTYDNWGKCLICYVNLPEEMLINYMDLGEILCLNCVFERDKEY